MLRRGGQTYFVARTPLIAVKRQRRLAKLRIGIGVYLIVLAACGPVFLAKIPAWTLGNIIFATSMIGGLGAWQLVRGVPRLRALAREQALLKAREPAQLPEARIV